MRSTLKINLSLFILASGFVLAGVGCSSPSGTDTASTPPPVTTSTTTTGSSSTTAPPVAANPNLTPGDAPTAIVSKTPPQNSVPGTGKVPAKGALVVKGTNPGPTGVTPNGKSSLTKGQRGALAAAGSYNLRLNPTQGEHYSLAIQTGPSSTGGTPGMGMSMNIVTDISYPTVSASQIIQKSRITKFDMNLPGMQQNSQIKAQMQKTMDSVKAMTFTEVMNRQGKATKTTVSGGDPQLAKAAQQFGGSMASSFTAFPAHPVKIGDTWQGTSGKIQTPLTYKLIAVKTVNGKQVAEVSMNSSLNKSGMQSKMAGTMEFDLATGVINSGKISTSTIMQGKSNVMDTTIKRQ